MVTFGAKLHHYLEPTKKSSENALIELQTSACHPIMLL
ncbi:hypothetical protein D1AOALGA4SA_11209 [Olavius algarvensis Delta 1 endosymbiont]|nr:hypothetical protein D1AOALGA4SA_11209 [Olavius algarvensis Delta 1 endosymbiont]